MPDVARLKPLEPTCMQYFSIQPHAIAERRMLTPPALLQDTPGLTSVRHLSTNRFREMRARLPEFTAEHPIFTMAIELFGVASTCTN
jgi:hypothetical protein